MVLPRTIPRKIPKSPRISFASTVIQQLTPKTPSCLQIQPGKKNIKAAIKAALAEAQGYDDPDEPPVRPLEDMNLDADDDDEDAACDMSSPSTPSKRRCAHLTDLAANSHRVRV